MWLLYSGGRYLVYRVMVLLSNLGVAKWLDWLDILCIVVYNALPLRIVLSAGCLVTSLAGLPGDATLRPQKPR